jgi:hypothetical protein
MLQQLSVVVALVVLLLSRWVEGRWTDHGAEAALHQAVADLGRLPLSIGPWQGQDQELDPSDIARARLAGSLWRRYHHAATGQVVSVVLVCGRPGPVSVHTPDVCYGGAGYEAVSTPVRTSVSIPQGPTYEFWSGQFSRAGAAVPENLLICWAWNAAGTWEAPEYPRLHYARFPALYKLYVISQTAPGEASSEENPCREFLRQLLPELDRCLGGAGQAKDG